MIICKKCGFDNPMTTVFCRSCGDRLDFTMGQIANAVSQGKVEKRDLEVLGWGRSAISLCAFALVVALVVRYLVVPEVPPADVPRAPDLILIEGEPAWARSAVSGPETGRLDDLISVADRLHWRGQVGTQMLSGFGIDFAPLSEAQTTLLGLQKSDGSFPGPNDLAATGLAALGLQAWPRSPEHLAAAAKARAWIESQWSRLSSASPTAKTLALAALIDANVLDERRRTELGSRLVDGSAPLWQTISLLGMSAQTRPENLVALSNKLSDHHWIAVFQMLANKKIDAPITNWFTEYSNTLPTFEARLTWAALSWHVPRAPEELSAALRLWCAAPDVPIDATTREAVGDAIAKPSLRLMLAGVPLRIPALQLMR